MYHWNLRKSQPIVGAYQARAGGGRDAMQCSTVQCVRGSDICRITRSTVQYGQMYTKC